MKIERKWAQPSRHTFTIKPITDLLRRYVGSGIGWVDPFAGYNSPAEFTNDLDPTTPARSHLDALEFCTHLQGIYKGILFDPPYSLRQLKECYNNIGIDKIPYQQTIRFYADLKDVMVAKIQLGGYAISFGWNSIGFGKKRGFQILEILLVSHGRAHNDTIVTVDIKKYEQGRLTQGEYET